MLLFADIDVFLAEDVSENFVDGSVDGIMTVVVVVGLTVVKVLPDVGESVACFECVCVDVGTTVDVSLLVGFSVTAFVDNVVRFAGLVASGVVIGIVVVCATVEEKRVVSIVVADDVAVVVSVFVDGLFLV